MNSTEKFNVGTLVEEEFLITTEGKELLGHPLSKTIEGIEELKNT